MSTYNGEKYLREQIDSILTQKGVHVELFIRDDGSTDNTLSILSEYEGKYNNIHIERGINLGCAKSFIHALISAPEFDYYAFSDQDDVWLDEKLVSAVKIINQEQSRHNKIIPIVWHSNVNLTDSSLHLIRTYKFEKRVSSIESFLLSPTGQGCAMVMNSKVRELVKIYGALCYEHDYLVIVLTYAEAGIVIFDPRVFILYRQHGSNVSQPATTLTARIIRVLKNLASHSCFAAKNSKKILQAYGDKLSNDTKNNLVLVAGHRENWIYRIKIILSPKFVTGYWINTLLGKIKVLFGNL